MGAILLDARKRLTTGKNKSHNRPMHDEAGKTVLSETRKLAAIMLTDMVGFSRNQRSAKSVLSRWHGVESQATLRIANSA